MSTSEVPEIDAIRKRLSTLERQLEREMRARGFDPAQIDTVALTTTLAELYNQREELRSELVRLTVDKNDES
jgi:hypothetical protein